VLTLGDREFAVEATEVVVGAEVTAYFSFQSLQLELTSAARRAGVMRDRFIVSYYPPVPYLRRRK
jgi:hypothetical protein